MRIRQTIKPLLQTAAISAAAFCATQAVTAQEPPKVSSCISAGEMLELFLSEETGEYSTYSESVGARVQRQHPTTHMYLHTKYIDRTNGSGAVCQYLNNIGVVANYFVLDAYAEASDGECGPRYCIQGAYWRKEWSESSEADDRPGEEYIYTCMKDRPDGRAFPSGACGFSLPEE